MKLYEEYFLEAISPEVAAKFTKMGSQIRAGMQATGNKVASAVRRFDDTQMAKLEAKRVEELIAYKRAVGAWKKAILDKENPEKIKTLQDLYKHHQERANILTKWITGEQHQRSVAKMVDRSKQQVAHA
jgi:primosomal protein N'